MPHESDWLDQDEAARQTYDYYMRMDPNQREFLGPIEVRYDEIFGREVKQRLAKIGMVRGAKSENMVETTVFLEPFPHARMEHSRPLQGWYSGKSDGDDWRQRDRPCNTDAVLTQPYTGSCPVRCPFCLPAGELVNTPFGPRAVETLKAGDLIWGRGPEGVVTARVVAETSHVDPVGYLKILLSDSRVIKLTEEHPVWSKSRGWIAAGQLLVGEGVEVIEETQKASESLLALRGRRYSSEYVPELLRPLRTDSPFGDSGVPAGESARRKGASHAFLQGLRSSHTQKKTPLLRQPGLPASVETGCSTGSARGDNCEAIVTSEGNTEVFGYSPSDVKSRSSTARRSVFHREVASDGGVEAWAGRGGSGWCQRVSTITAMLFYGLQRAFVPNAVYVGGVVGGMVGPSGVPMGVRAVRSFPSRWERVFTRLSAVRRAVTRSKRSLLTQVSFQGGILSSTGVPRSATFQEGAHPVGCVRVEKITRVPGSLRVYDIQTTTENFYHNGVLVHNCYVNASSRGYRASGITMVPLNYGAFVRKNLDKFTASQAGYFTSFHEPFNALEPIYHNTQSAAEAFVERGLPIFFLSRMSYPDWAIDLLRRSPFSYAQKSINTPDEDDWRKLSPNALTLAEHMDEIRKLRAAGVYVSVQCNPVVAGIVTHEDVERLFEMLAAAGANHVIVKFVEANHPWVPGLISRMTERFGGNRAAMFKELFTEKQGGAQTTINEEYRREGHTRYRKKATSLGMTYSLCYEYTKQGNRWKSMGPEFLTADQCHGHRVPWHVKGADGMFRPLSVCPPSGCLTCADENGGRARCGSELLGSAKALVAADFKRVPKIG